MRSIRPPSLAALLILVVAGGIIAALLARDPSSAGAPEPHTPAEPRDGATPDAIDAVQSVQVPVTANAYERPSRQAAVALVVPGGEHVGVHGRSDDASWVLISHPPGTQARGWLRRSSLDAPGDAIDALPLVRTEAQALTTADDAQEGLPDLTIQDAFLLQDGRLAVAIRNIGGAALEETEIGLHVSRADGEILGVLRVGPTALPPGGSATVVTPVAIEEPATYRLALDPRDEIAEQQERNNAHSALLIPAS